MRALADGSLMAIVAWWASLLLLGWLAWPLTQRLFSQWPDRGYFASKIVGLLLASWLAWFAASLHAAHFSGLGPVTGLSGLVMLFIVLRPRQWPLSSKQIAALELGFTVLFLLGVAIKVSDPDIRGLEKFMDFAFMNAAMRSSTMPPVDPWFSGNTINYYYFGHATAGWLTLFARVRPDHGFNLMMATIFALFAGQVFALVWSATTGAGRRTSVILSVLAAMCATLGTHLQTIMYGVFRPLITSHTGRPDYYFPDATRFVGFDPPTQDKLITEMAAYGFAVGDMHAHVLNLPCVTLLLGLLVLLWQNLARDGGASLKLDGLAVVSLGFCFGLCAMANPWDAVIHGSVMLVLAMAVLCRAGGTWKARLGEMMAKGLAMLTVAVLVSSPFLASFIPFGQGVQWSSQHTPIWQLALLIGHALPISVVALAMIVLRKASSRLILGGMLATAAILLQLVPEVIFLKDIYGSDFARANTAFKITFQTHILLTLASFISAAALLEQWRKGLLASLPILLLLPVLATLIYPKFWFFDRWTSRSIADASLEGVAFMAREAPDDAGLLPYLQSLRLKDGESIIEAPGDSYTMAARFSALTGLPTPVGWKVHQWLWRKDYGKVHERTEQVKRLYEAPTDEVFCELLAAFSARYVIVGQQEVERYPGLQRERFARLLKPRQTSGASTVFEVPPGACGPG